MRFSSFLALAFAATAVSALPKNGADDVTTTLSNGATTTIDDHGSDAFPTPSASGDHRGNGADDGNSTEDGDRSTERHGGTGTGTASGPGPTHDANDDNGGSHGGSDDNSSHSAGSDDSASSSPTPSSSGSLATLSPASANSNGAEAHYGASLSLGLVSALAAIVVGL